MAYGVENQIGIGSAQVLPQGPSHMPLAQQLYRQKQDREEKERQEKKDRDLDEYNRIKIVGDALDPRNFNQLIHTKVRDATAELAAKLKDKPSLADTYLMAQQHAGKLGHMSDQFNQLQQTLSKTRDEYKFDKRLNTNAISEEALKNALHDFNTKGEVDLTKNYYDEALNDLPDIALTDKSDYTVVDFKNARKQDLFGKYTDINKAGRTDKYDWKTEYYPDLYDFKDNGEAKEPTMTTKAQPSGLKDENNRDVPMLAEEAYGFFKTLPSNVVAINKRLQGRYPDLNLRSEEAETLRRIEAYKDVEGRKPKINKAIVEKEAPTRSHSFYFGSGYGQGGATGQTQGSAFNEITKNIKHLPVKEGLIYDKDGESVFNGSWKINSTDIPADIQAILNTGGYDLRGVKQFDAEIEGGSIIGLTPMQGLFKGKKINEDAMKRAQQKYYNPGKGEPYIEFPKGGQNPPKPSSGTIKGSEVPKGAKVTQKDGSYYYNGKKII